MRTQNTTPTGDQTGFTLVEALIALMILTVGILGVNVMQVGSINTNIRAGKTTVSTSWGAEKLEFLMDQPFDDIKLADSNGNGTAQDADKNGVDDNGGNFGLDDEGANADHTEQSTDKRYTLSWNVAVDRPMAGCKTIRMIISRPEEGRNRNTVITMIKLSDEKAKGSA